MKFIATVHDVDGALLAIDGYVGTPEDFVLRIAQSAIAPISVSGQVVSGVNMAIIGDRILSRNWCPKGFEDEGDFRLYFYGAW